MIERGHKDAAFGHLARVGKALAAPRRVELLDLLAQTPRSVESLAEQTGMSVANTSRHLQVLRAGGLVVAQKVGLYVIYALASDQVALLTVIVRHVAHTGIAELDRVTSEFSGKGDDVEGLDRKKLVARVKRGEVVLLDVRPHEEYEGAHLAGAISIPHDELRRRLAELPKDRKIVAYCRGPYCVFAVHAVRLLRARGFDATRLTEGVLDWRVRGLPIAGAASEVQA